MQYVRLYADSDGETHFQDVEAEFHPVQAIPGQAPVDMTEAIPASEVVFVRGGTGLSIDYHPAPRRHLFTVIAGEWKMSTSDGDSRLLRATDVILVEDTNSEDTKSKGHISQVVSPEDFLGFFAWLPD